MSSIQDLGVFRSQLPCGRSPNELRACGVELQDREHTRNSFGPLPQGYCERKTPS